MKNNDPNIPTEPILQFFEYAHLPPHLQEVVVPFHELAHAIVRGRLEKTDDDNIQVVKYARLPRNAERTTALRKLLEAKDCAVRAVLFKETP